MRHLSKPKSNGGTSPKWAWVDIKAEYFSAYPKSKEEFFAQAHPEIPEKTWHEVSVGWKEEREAYRIKLAENRLSLLEEASNQIALRHMQKGSILLDAVFENLIEESTDPETGQKRISIKKEILSKASLGELIRLGHLGATTERNAWVIHQQMIEPNENNVETVIREKKNERQRRYLTAIIKNPEARKAADLLLKIEQESEGKDVNL